MRTRLIILGGILTGLACDMPLNVQCGTPAVEVARIEWGAGVDGVRMGNGAEVVRAALGEPDGPHFR